MVVFECVTNYHLVLPSPKAMQSPGFILWDVVESYKY